MIFPILSPSYLLFSHLFLFSFPFLSYSEPLTFPFFGKLACKAFDFFFSIQKKILNKNLKLVFKRFCHFVLFIQKKKKISSFLFYWLDASESKDGPSPGTPTVFSPGSCLGSMWLLWTCPISTVQAASSFTRLLSVFQSPSLAECFSHRMDAQELLAKEGE